MKVLQINAVFGYGSTGTIAKDIHEQLSERGVESFVACSMMPASVGTTPGVFKIGSLPDRKIHALLSRLFGKQAYYSRFTTKLLLKRINKLCPDVVHLHNLHNNYINLPLLCTYLQKKHIATVITLHDCWYYTGGCYHYTVAGCSQWKTGCEKCPKRFQDTPALLADFSKKIFCDRKKYFLPIQPLALVGVSNWIADEAGKSFFHDKLIRVIRNGVDTGFFQPVQGDVKKKYGIEEKFLILGFANKWFLPENKTFLSLMKEFTCEHSSACLIVGCTQQQQKTLPAAWISLPAVRSREEMRNIYSSCDVFVNCTHEESLSLVNLEAQSCGTPIITFATTGARETVDGSSGFSVAEDNVSDVFRLILEIQSNGKNFYSESCRNFVCENFEKENSFQEYLKLYEEITGYDNTDTE